MAKVTAGELREAYGLRNCYGEVSYTIHVNEAAAQINAREARIAELERECQAALQRALIATQEAQHADQQLAQLRSASVKNVSTPRRRLRTVATG
ncbi:hypothetical protein GCM10027040_05010 [Halomonas shantousis]